MVHNENTGRVCIKDKDGKWTQRYPDSEFSAYGDLGSDYWYIVDSVPGQLNPPANEDVERVALDLYLSFNPNVGVSMPDDFGFPAGPAPTHIDDVFDGGRWRKLAKHVIANYGRGA